MRCVRAAAVRCTGNSCNRASGGQIIWVEAATVQCSKAQHSAVPTLALNEAGGGHQACPPLHPCLINRRPLSLLPPLAASWRMAWRPISSSAAGFLCFSSCRTQCLRAVEAGSRHGRAGELTVVCGAVRHSTAQNGMAQH